MFTIFKQSEETMTIFTPKSSTKLNASEHAMASRVAGTEMPLTVREAPINLPCSSRQTAVNEP
jgi:hypothetical protein